MRIVEYYLQFLKAVSNLSSSSEDVYKREIHKFFRYLGKRKYENIIQKDILSYLDHLKKYEVSTARRKIAIVKAFFRYLEMQGKISSSPFNKIHRTIRPGNNKKKRNKPTLTRDEITKLLTPESEISKMSFEDLRNEVIVRLYLATGVRRIELLKIKLTNLDLEINRITIKAENVKRKREREVFFDDVTAQWLKWYLDRRKSHKAYHKQLSLFIAPSGRTIGLGTLRRIIENRFEKIGLGRKFKCHLFRHTFATILLEHGAHPKIVQELLGHKNIATTLDIYSHPSQEYLRKAYKKTNPFKDLQARQDKTKEKEPLLIEEGKGTDFDEDLR